MIRKEIAKLIESECKEHEEKIKMYVNQYLNAKD